MLRKKFSVWFFITALLTALWSPAALAHSNHHNGHHKPHHQPKQTLVALGDSIPFGYGLEKNMNQPSRYAYPALIGKKTGMNVRNLSVSSALTTDLLAALNGNQSLRNTVRKANYVTLDIGGFDLIKAYENDDKLTPQEAQTVLANIQKIVAGIRGLTSAPIVVYNVYNPFPANSEEGRVADPLIRSFNKEFAAIVRQSGDRKVVIADAYKAFSGRQSAYIFPGDVHPTRLGHERLAEIGWEAFKSVKHHQHQQQR